MNYVCSHCRVSSFDGNVFCPRAECSVRNLVKVLRRGDFFGEFEITNPVRVMRTATVYEAIRENTPVLLKVAHYDSSRINESDYGYSGYLKQEAERLAKIQQEKLLSHPALPKLLQPYGKTTLRQENYGKVTLNGQLRYYLVFEHTKGQFLADYLDNHPQPPHYQAGWLIQTLVDLIAIFHTVLKVPHLAITPETIFVRLDEENILRPILMDFGFAPPFKIHDMSSNEYQSLIGRYLHPAYTAPEVLTQQLQIVREADIYNIGLLLYQVLAGRPVYEHVSQTDENIRIAIQDSRPPNLLGRADLAPGLNDLVNSMVAKEPNYRPNKMSNLNTELKKYFGAVPKEKLKKSPWRRMLDSKNMARASVVILFILLAIVILGLSQVLF